MTWGWGITETGRNAPRLAVPSPAGYAGDLSPSRERWIRARKRPYGGGITAYAGMTVKG